MAEKLKPYTARRRGTLRFVLSVGVGESVNGMTCSGALRKLDVGETTLAPVTPVAAEFDIDPFSGTATEGPGWFLSLSAAMSANLEAGARYLADATITINGEPFVTKSWIVEVLEPASGQ